MIDASQFDLTIDPPSPPARLSRVVQGLNAKYAGFVFTDATRVP